MVFSVGDIIEVKRECSSCIPGKKYTVYANGVGELFARNEELKKRNISGCSCQFSNWIKIEGTKTETKTGGNKMTKRVYEVMVIDNEKEKIVLKEIVMSENERSVENKVSVKFATTLKDLDLDNLTYITRELGSFEKKESKK